MLIRHRDSVLISLGSSWICSLEFDWSEFNHQQCRHPLYEFVWISLWLIQLQTGFAWFWKFLWTCRARLKDCEKTEPRRCPWTQQRVVSCAAWEGVCSWREASGAEHRGSKPHPPLSLTPSFVGPFSPCLCYADTRWKRNEIIASFMVLAEDFTMSRTDEVNRLTENVYKVSLN